ncbi:MAG: insulinase family protein [Bacteroidales bacterium]|nr:insulinase family protein [Bacteroidales bacterium]
MITGTCPSGLRYAVKRSGHAVAYCALSIGTGTRDEAGFPAGTAHFTEHAMFRGTARKSAAVISSYLDRLGGELNAYTTKEEIVLHATVLKEDLGKAARLLFELATQATFPADEIETERGVILDEIISYKDNPAEDVYDNFEALLFKGSALETPILGTTASVKKITPGMLRRFVAEKFVPERMAFTVVADIDEAKLEKTIISIISDSFRGFQPLQNDNTLKPSCHSERSERIYPFSKVIDKRNHEVNAVIGGRAPSLHEMPDRLVAAMLVNILGGPASNSLLNAELREKRGWVYGIECSYTQYADTGIVAIAFGCDKPNLDKCVDAIHKILRRLAEKPMTDARLRACRKQLLGQLAISSESGEAQCLSMGKSLLAWSTVMSEEETRKRLEAITAEDLQKMALRLFAQDHLSSLVYL